MKKFVILITLGAISASLNAATIKQWDFNSLVSDFVDTTGTLRPADGVGAPTFAVGGVGNRFGTVATGASGDPNTLDNSQWRLGQNLDNTGGFPAAGAANKTAGAQFPVNTSGFTNVQMFWSQENSASASRYWRVQYTINGTDWLDSTNVIVASSIDTSGTDTGTPAWVLNHTVDFSAVPGVNNNTNFAVRLVSEFESTATGSGADAYVANRQPGNYTIAGTLWLDMVIFTGDDLDPGNQPPLLSSIADQTVLVGQATPALGFTVSDAETPADSLALSAFASDNTLISSVTLGGSGGSRTVLVTPATGLQGTAMITIRATDGGGKTAETSFSVVVTLPTMSKIADQIVSPDSGWVSNSFTIFNLPGDPATWVLAGSSSNTNAIADANIAFTGSDSNRVVAILPKATSSGDTVITITATSGPWQATTNFAVKVLPPRIVFFNLTGLPSTGGTNQAYPTTIADGLSVSTLTRGPGINMAGLGSGFSADNWNNTNSTTHPVSATRDNAIAEGEYFQFAVTVADGFGASFTTIESSMRRSALDAPRFYEWQYSFDGFATAGLTATNFTYIGRSSGTAPATVVPYSWMTTDTAGQGNGNPTWPFWLTGIPALQNIPGGGTVTFRLYGWGRDFPAGADSNTVALGRTNGPAIRGIVSPLLAVTRSGSDVVISWSTNAAGYSLKATSSLSPANWQTPPETPSVVGDKNAVTILNPADTRFFRLEK